MPSYQIWLILLGLVHAAVIARALLVETRSPSARAAWLLLLVLLPGLGVLIYLLFGEPWVSKRWMRETRAAFEKLTWTGAAEGSSNLDAIPERYRPAFRTCERIAHWPTTHANLASLAADSNAAVDSMIRDVDAATESVHISFYIWLTDRNGRKMIEAVKRAAARGVTCRVVVDAIGSRSLIASRHWREMREAGVKLCVSLAVRSGLKLRAASRIDLRNHRKIVVADGRVAYCGSQNCADPEFLVKRKYAPWVDVMMRFTGPVARQTQFLFASDWMAETNEDPSELFAGPPPPDEPGGFPAVAIGTGPLSPSGAMSEAFVGVLYCADREIVVSTPYFAPDAPLLAALTSAARRGAATTLILPARNDSFMVGAMSRANYARLIRAGVRIFEFRGGLLHAKTIVADGVLAFVGSANMDRRSLELNFENNILLYSPEMAGELRARQDVWLANAGEVAASDLEKRSMRQRIMQNFLTIFEPVF